MTPMSGCRTHVTADKDRLIVASNGVQLRLDVRVAIIALSLDLVGAIHFTDKNR